MLEIFEVNQCLFSRSQWYTNAEMHEAISQSSFQFIILWKDQYLIWIRNNVAIKDHQIANNNTLVTQALEDFEILDIQNWKMSLYEANIISSYEIDNSFSNN